MFRGDESEGPFPAPHSGAGSVFPLSGRRGNGFVAEGMENNVGTRGQPPLPLHWEEGRTRQICHSLTGTA